MFGWPTSCSSVHVGAGDRKAAVGGGQGAARADRVSMAPRDYGRSGLREVRQTKVEALEINEGTGPQQVIQSEDPVGGKAVIHGSHLDREAGNLPVFHGKEVQALGERGPCSSRIFIR